MESFRFLIFYREIHIPLLGRLKKEAVDSKNVVNDEKCPTNENINPVVRSEASNSHSLSLSGMTYSAPLSCSRRVVLFCCRIDVIRCLMSRKIFYFR